MKKKEAILFCVLIALSAHLFASQERFNDNLLSQTTFQPVVVDKEAVAAKGWFINDFGRDKLVKGPDYIDGRRCFKLEFSNDGCMTIRFAPKGSVPDVYWGKGFMMGSLGSWGNNCKEPLVYAPKYHAVYEIRIDMGAINLPGKKRVKASKDFQKLDYFIDKPELTQGGQIIFSTHPGCIAEFRKTYLAPWYPQIGGAINLPDGGKLTKFIVAKDADFKIRMGVMAWRGWFWRLTGIALPIEVRAKPAPENGAFVIVSGEAAKGGYKLKIDKKGALLTIRDSRDAYASVCNYIRKHGVRLYSRDTQVIPAVNPKLTLIKTDENLIPRFIKLPLSSEGSLNGGAEFGNLSSEVDWYDYHRHLVSHEWCNQLVPMHHYYKEHPEYYMMLEDGKRQKESNPLLMTICLTHPEVLQIAARRFPQYMLANDHTEYTSMCLGDRPIFCQCPTCKKLNDGESATNSLMAFMNHLMASLRKANPKSDLKISFAAYHMYRFPPTKVKPGPGIQISYCAQSRAMPCQVHIDCEINRHAIADFRKWSELVGKDNLGVSLYEEVRPYHDARVFEFFTKNARRSFNFHSFSSAGLQYVAGRYRFGDDPVKATEEFMEAYYGGGSKHIKAIFRKLDQFCLHYKHTEQDKREACLSVLPGRVIHWKTVLTRDFFDGVYPLFDKALAEAGNNHIARSHILYERYRFLLADLPKYPRSVCTSEKELKAFSCRLACFMNTLMELEQLQKQNPLDTNRIRVGKNLLLSCAEKPFLTAVSGLSFTPQEEKKKWNECQEIQNFLKNPETYFIGKTGVKRISGGYEWDVMSMFGGDGPSASGTRCLRRPASGKGVISIILKLDKAPKHTCRLIIKGKDDDKPGASTFKVLVNGKQVFTGPNTLSETAQSAMGIDIPEDTLVAGENKIELVNTMPELPSDRKKLPQNDTDYGDVYEVNYFRGWISIKTIQLLDLSGEFSKLLQKQKSIWTSGFGKKATLANGIVQTADKKLHIVAEDKNIIINTPMKKKALYAVHPGEKLRLFVKVSGKGEVGLNLWCLDANGNYNHKAYQRTCSVTNEETWCSDVLKVPNETHFIVPGIIAKANSDFLISDFKMETEK